MEEMTYEKTIELEKNIKIKNKAKEIVAGFKKNVSLNLETKEGNRFTIWKDSNNAIYVEVTKDDIILICDFLNEDYEVNVKESCVFSGIKQNYRGIGHLASVAKVEYNPYDYRV